MLEIGHVTKPHGLRGDVIVKLTTNRLERLSPGSILTTSKGEHTVVNAMAHKDRWIVSFEGVVDYDGAENLRGLILEAPPLDDPDALWVHELVGKKVSDVSGRMYGTVIAVQDNPAGDLLVLDDEVLIPLRFVVETNPDDVVVDAPPGLIE